MEYIKPPTSHLSWGTLVNFGAVQEIANKNKIVRFEGIQDNKSVADTANNNIEKTKRKPIGRQKRKDKIRRSQARKEKIRMQKREEEAEEEAEKMQDLSWKNFSLAADEINIQDFESLSDDEKQKFITSRTQLIRNNKYVFFGFHLDLARTFELQKIDEAKFPGGGTDEQSLALSSDSDTLKVVEVVEPTGFDEVLDHSFVSDETKQKLKELMDSGLNKKQKQEALLVWLHELASALDPHQSLWTNPLLPFYEYVKGDGFGPNAIVQQFISRGTALSSVDQSSDGTDSAFSSISSQSTIRSFHFPL